MKVLVLSCNTGEGHNAAGRAVCEKFRERGVCCEFVDAMSFAGKNVSKNVTKTYVFITTHVPRVFGALYKAGDFISSSKRKSPVYLANKAFKKKLERYLLEERFDAVVMPHLFPAETITSLRRENRVQLKTVAVATDYTCIPFWEECDVDRYIVPHRDLMDDFVQKGIAREKLLPYGIPVSNQFREKVEKREARRALSLDEEKPMFLIMSGSMGFGKVGMLIEEALSRFGDGVNIVVLGGTNTKLKNKLREQFKARRTVMVLDFTKKVSLYMDACDVIFTKPGGLTSTEAAVKNIPLVHTCPIPGCETINACFFKEHGMSLFHEEAKGQIDCAERLLKDSALREHMLSCQRQHCNPAASDEICDLVMGELCGKKE